MDLSNYLENKVADMTLRALTYTSPASIWLGLFTTDPTDAGSGTEVTVANGYARVQVAFDAPVANVIDNTLLETFTAAGGNWGTITHFGLFDASAAGNLLVHSAMTDSRVMNDTDTLDFAAGDITVTFGTEYSNYLKDALLNAIFRGVSYTSPANAHLAFYTAAPTDADVGTEVSLTNGYARQTVVFDAPSNGVTQNTNLKTFTASGGAWGTITHMGLRDAATAGNLLFHSALTASKIVNDGTVSEWQAGILTVTLT